MEQVGVGTDGRYWSRTVTLDTAAQLQCLRAATAPPTDTPLRFLGARRTPANGLRAREERAGAGGAAPHGLHLRISTNHDVLLRRPPVRKHTKPHTDTHFLFDTTIKYEQKYKQGSQI